MVDVSAIDLQARADLKGHVDVCTERYGNIWSKLTDMTTAMNADRVARAAADQALHDRLNTVSSRMWLAATSLCAMAILGLAVMVVRGLK